MKHKNIQYGCGWSSPKDWRNFDGSLTLRFERIPFLGKLYTKNKERFPENVEYGDIVKGLPISDNYSNYVYCSHILEHLSLNDCRRALSNTYRILKKDGIFRLVLPDFENCIKEYLINPSSLKFLKGAELGFEDRPKTISALIYDFFQTSRHYWMWDYGALEKELIDVGFINVRRAYFGDSDHEIFDSVEDYDRWNNCLGIECQK